MSAQREFDTALGARLLQVREQSGHTREHVARQARALGLPWHRTTVGQIEQGKHGVSAYALTVAARVFGVPWAELVEGLPEPSPVVVGPCEATVKAARRLSRSPSEVDAVAYRLWGRSLTAERDARVGNVPRTRAAQARRGHVTRQLIDELRMAAGDDTARSATEEPHT